MAKVAAQKDGVRCQRNAGYAGIHRFELFVLTTQRCKTGLSVGRERRNIHSEERTPKSFELRVGFDDLSGFLRTLEISQPTLDLFLKTHNACGDIVRGKSIQPGEKPIAGRLLLPLQNR